MKYFWLFNLILIGHILNAQQLGSVSSSSQSNNSPFSVGEIFVEGNLSGYIGVFSFIVGNSLLTSSVDINIDDDFTIIPNPTNGSFEIKTRGRSIKDINLIDVSGRTIKSFHLEGQGDISDLSPGLYFLQINHKNTFKIIKN